MGDQEQTPNVRTINNHDVDFTKPSMIQWSFTLDLPSKTKNSESFVGKWIFFLPVNEYTLQFSKAKRI